MALAERKQRETEELRQRALDEAEALFVVEGPASVTMRRVADRIHYAPTVLYRLFANKDDLLDHLIARGYDGVRAEYEGALADPDGDPRHGLERILRVYVRYGLGHPNHYRMWFDTGHLRLDGDRLRLDHGRLEFVVFQPWLDQIRACVTAGVLAERPSFELFQILWAGVHGIISLRIQHPDLPWIDPERQLADLLDALGPR